MIGSAAESNRGCIKLVDPLTSSHVANRELPVIECQCSYCKVLLCTCQEVTVALIPCEF